MPEEPKRVSFTIKSVPFMGDPEGADRFYAAAGRFLRLWGRLETQLDFMLGVIASLPEWQAPPKWPVEGVPASMRLKADMWRIAFKGMPPLAPQRDTALRFMSDMMDTNQDRAVIVHSIWESFTSPEPLTVKMVSRRRKGRTIFVDTRFVTLDQIEKVITDADSLNTRLLVLGFFLIRLTQRKREAGTP